LLLPPHFSPAAAPSTTALPLSGAAPAPAPAAATGALPRCFASSRPRRPSPLEPLLPSLPLLLPLLPLLSLPLPLLLLLESRRRFDAPLDDIKLKLLVT
jgi:hypothetical protein